MKSTGLIETSGITTDARRLRAKRNRLLNNAVVDGQYGICLLWFYIAVVGSRKFIRLRLLHNIIIARVMRRVCAVVS
jgi:hypothetical protein